MRVVDLENLFQELGRLVYFVLRVGSTELLVPGAGPQDFKKPSAESRATKLQEAQGFGYNLDVPCHDAIIKVKGGHVERIAVVRGKLAELFYNRTDGKGKQQWSQGVTLLNTSS